MRIKSTLLEMTTETKGQKSQEERLKLKGVGFSLVFGEHTHQCHQILRCLVLKRTCGKFKIHFCLFGVYITCGILEIGKIVGWHERREESTIISMVSTTNKLPWQLVLPDVV